MFLPPFYHPTLLVGWRSRPRDPLSNNFGLGHRLKDQALEPEVLTPCQIDMVPDSRPIDLTNLTYGEIKTVISRYYESKGLPAPHAQSYNTLFCEGHVALAKRCDYLAPPRSARYRKGNNQRHPET